MVPLIKHLLRQRCRSRLFSLLGLGLLLIFASPLVVLAQSGEQLRVGPFSQAQPGTTFPYGWQPLTFENIPTHTQYELVEDDDQVVVKAVSQQSASGMKREITIDPKEHPIVAWRWKVKNILQHGDVTKKSGDDYPARLYIMFEYDSRQIGFFEQAQYEVAKLLYGQYPPLASLTYIWESKSPIGRIVPNPYTDRVYMIVLESGTPKLNQWVKEERNVYEDYKNVFGEDPPKISGVAIMTDTDNTQENAIAYFGDIVFKKK